MPLSTKQMEYLAIAWQCFETDPKIDYEKFKTVAGLASAASARELMRVTKNKLKTEYGALGASVASSNAKTSPVKKTPATTPKSGAKRSRGKKAATEDDDDDEEEQTPAKKSKAGKKGGVVKEEPSAADDDDILA